MDRALTVGEGYDLILETYTTKGRKIIVRTTCEVTMLNGKPAKLTGIFQDITEQKLIESELIKAKEHAEESELNLIQINEQFRLSNQLLEESQTVAKLGGWELDILANKLFWTAETYRIHDTSPEEFNPTVDAGVSYFLPESKKTIIEALDRAMTLGEGYDLQLETYTTKGRKIIVRTTCEVTMLNGKAVKLTGIFQDITEQKLIESELIKAKEKAEENEAMFLAAMDNSQAGIAIAEYPTGKLKYVNRAGLAVRDKDYDSVVKDIDIEKYVSSWQILHFDGTPFESDEVPLSRAVLYGERNSREFIIRRDNHEDRYVWANAAPIYNDQGLQTAAIVVFLDITERKMAEEEIERAKQAMEENAAMLQSITDNIPAYIGVVDSSILHYKFVNQSFPKSFNKTKEDIVGHHISEVIGQANTAFAMKFIEEVRKGKSTSYINTFDLAEGKRYVNVNYVPGFDKNGHVKDIIVLSHDITEIKKSEQELILAKEKAEESDRLKSSFLANMSHEIRTPLNSIIGFSELLSDPDYEPDQKVQFTKTIIENGNNLLVVINDILDLSMLDSKQMTVRKEKIHIDNLIADIADLFKLKAQLKGLEFKQNIPLHEDELFIESDLFRIKQIFTNLISNALKFTSKGYVEIGYSIQNKAVEFFVKDSGIGIAPKNYQAVFERFRQIDLSHTRKYGGNGLGLAICKNICTMLDGNIRVVGEEGKGSTFFFTIPFICKPFEKDISTIEIDLNHTKDAKPKQKILIAEDDESSEKLISIIIQKLEKEIIKAKTGIEAVEACRNNPNIDLVLMDIQMPEMDGYEATRQIRQFNKNIIIIAQTAYAMSGDKDKALEAGCNDYISKPIIRDDLIRILKKYS